MTGPKDVEIRLLPTREEYRNSDEKEEPRVADIIRTEVLPQKKEEYYRVDVQIMRKADQTPEYLVAYLLRKDIYLAEVARVDLTQDLEVKKVDFSYEPGADEEGEHTFSHDDLAPSGERAPTGLPALVKKPDFVIATPVDDIPSAKNAVNELTSFLTSAGFTCVKLLGSQATVAAYQHYLAMGLGGFINIGHGNTQGIALADGFLSSTWFRGLVDTPLRPAVVYFNSCQVHNDPLKDAVMDAGTQTFVGGIVNLGIGSSEEVCKCFWKRIANSLIGMKDGLSRCEVEKYPTTGAHGICGNLGPFGRWHNDKVLVRTHAKAGNQMAYALFSDSAWINVRPASPDGVTNVFDLLCVALASKRHLDVYINEGQIEQATLR
ncbi:hypothetical protein DSECCO2_342000 [anaerobic digester metagenome]